MTAWLALIPVGLAYLSIAAACAAEKLRGARALIDDAHTDQPIPYWPTTAEQAFYEWADATMLLFAGSDRDDELHPRRMGR